MRDAVIPAISIERMLAADAHPRHQAARRVIDAGVDHLAVARRGDGADPLGRLQHDHLAAGLRQPPRDGKTDHPRTDNDALDLVHSRFGSGLVFDPARASSGAHPAINRARTMAQFGTSFFEQPVEFVSERFRIRALLVKH